MCQVTSLRGEVREASRHVWRSQWDFQNGDNPVSSCSQTTVLRGPLCPWPLGWEHTMGQFNL